MASRAAICVVLIAPVNALCGNCTNTSNDLCGGCTNTTTSSLATFTATTFSCPSAITVSATQDAPLLRGQPYSSGTTAVFSLTTLTSHGLEVYQNSNGAYVYFNELGGWQVGTSYTPSHASMISKDNENARCPHMATEWQLATETGWLPGVLVVSAGANVNINSVNDISTSAEMRPSSQCYIGIAFAWYGASFCV